MKEIWDLVDRQRQPLFKTHQRGKELQPGEYHLVVEVWTVKPEQQVLVTLRDPCKEEYPDKWENTGGSALAGESSRQAAIRELQEETGIQAREDELIFLGTCWESSALIDIYLLHRDIPVSSLTMQPGETVAARWISLAQLDQLITSRELALPTGRRLGQVRSAFDQALEKIQP